jgi:hypothetical protein
VGCVSCPVISPAHNGAFLVNAIGDEVKVDVGPGLLGHTTWPTFARREGTVVHPSNIKLAPTDDQGNS